jgi:uncharacterized membrane protein YbhN (UPF0104 family)
VTGPDDLAVGGVIERRPAEAEAPDSRRLLRRLLGLGLLIGLVALAVTSLPGLGTLRARFVRADVYLLALVGVLKLASCLSNVVAFRDVFCPRMGWRFSYELGMAEQATNVLLPTGGAGGLALGAWALHQGGMSTEHIGRRSVQFFVLTSLPNFAFAAILGPLLLLGVFSGDVPTAITAVFSALAWACVAVVAALPLVLTRIDPDKSSGRVMHKVRVAAVILGRGIRDTGELLRSGRWPAILGAFGYLAFDIAALMVSFSAFGGAPPLAPLIFGYVIGQLGGLIPLPGGIGGTDGGLIAAMVLYGSSLPQATAAVLAYRAFQLGVPAILGTIAFGHLRTTLSRSGAPAAHCEPLAEA